MKRRSVWPITIFTTRAHQTIPREERAIDSEIDVLRRIYGRLKVHQTVHDPEGKPLLDRMVGHVFRFSLGKVSHFDIRDA